MKWAAQDAPGSTISARSDPSHLPDHAYSDLCRQPTASANSSPSPAASAPIARPWPCSLLSASRSPCAAATSAKLAPSAKPPFTSFASSPGSRRGRPPARPAGSPESAREPARNGPQDGGRATMSSKEDVHLIREVAIRYVGAQRRIPAKITRPEEVAQYLRRRIRDDAREHFVAIFHLPRQAPPADRRLDRLDRDRDRLSRPPARGLPARDRDRRLRAADRPQPPERRRDAELRGPRGDEAPGRGRSDPRRDAPRPRRLGSRRILPLDPRDPPRPPLAGALIARPPLLLSGGELALPCRRCFGSRLNGSVHVVVFQQHSTSAASAGGIKAPLRSPSASLRRLSYNGALRITSVSPSPFAATTSRARTGRSAATSKQSPSGVVPRHGSLRAFHYTPRRPPAVVIRSPK